MAPGQLVQVEWNKGQAYLAWQTKTDLMSCCASYGNVKSPSNFNVTQKALNLHPLDRLSSWNATYIIGVVSPDLYSIINYNILPKHNFYDILVTNTNSYVS